MPSSGDPSSACWKPDPFTSNGFVVHMTFSGDSISACWNPDPSAQPFEFKLGFRASLIQGGTKPSLNSLGGPKQKVPQEIRKQSPPKILERRKRQSETRARTNARRQVGSRFYYYKGVTWSDFQKSCMCFCAVRRACKNACAEGSAQKP